MLTIHAFNGLTGTHLTRLPEITFSWQNSINTDGSFSVDAYDPDYVYGNILVPYKNIIAIIEGTKVYHAGYIKSAPYKRKDGKWQVSGGGFLAVLEKRLVMNYALYGSWKDGQVTVDEDRPKGNWPLRLKGSYSDLIAKLIAETKKWGTLPVDTAPLTGGSHDYTYNSFDLATTASRILEIGQLDDAPEFRFDAVLDNTGNLRFKQKTSSDNGEIIDHKWKLNALPFDSGIMLDDEDLDGSAMCHQAFAVGGRDDDKLLVARSFTTPPADAPLLQIGNTGHSSVSRLSTLQSYVRADAHYGSKQYRTVGFMVDRTRFDIHVGDWMDVRYGTSANSVFHLKVTDVSGRDSDNMLVLQCRERE